MNTVYSRSSRALERVSVSNDDTVLAKSSLDGHTAVILQRKSQSSLTPDRLGHNSHVTSPTLADPNILTGIGGGADNFEGGDSDDSPRIKKYMCLLGTCTSDCGFPCFDTHHFQPFQTDDLYKMRTHLADIHPHLASRLTEIPTCWSDDYVHSKNGWSCPRCCKFLGGWPANQKTIERHFERCSHGNLGRDSRPQTGAVRDDVGKR